ncbi:hypothetical protein [Pasteuria penetrans]|nr:hypothetical protein [Pasteuria penetrans]
MRGRGVLLFMRQRSFVVYAPMDDFHFDSVVECMGKREPRQ